VKRPEIKTFANLEAAFTGESMTHSMPIDAKISIRLVNRRDGVSTKNRMSPRVSTIFPQFLKMIQTVRIM
jgi:hypothetical protein